MIITIVVITILVLITIMGVVNYVIVTIYK